MGLKTQMSAASYCSYQIIGSSELFSLAMYLDLLLTSSCYVLISLNATTVTTAVSFVASEYW